MKSMYPYDTKTRRGPLGELAKRLGIPYQNLSRLEHGPCEGMLSTLNRYVQALGYELVITARPRRKSDVGPRRTPER